MPLISQGYQSSIVCYQGIFSKVHLSFKSISKIPLLLAFSPSEVPPSEAQLRLVGGNDTAGRLEIYLDGEWGTVCDDYWDLVDADVACRQLGFLGAISAPRYAAFGEGSEPTHLDDVECTGVETDLVSCAHTRLEDCGHSEDAGVVCNPHTGKCYPNYGM